MGAAFGWGTLAASSLVIGAIVALIFSIGLRTIGLIMAFGSGVLISAISFDLVQEAVDKSSGHGWVVGGFFAGCLVFFGGDRLIDRLGGGQRKDPSGNQASTMSTHAHPTSAHAEAAELLLGPYRTPAGATVGPASIPVAVAASSEQH